MNGHKRSWEPLILRKKAMRGPSACLNFADSVWRLPIPLSCDVIDIQKAAAVAAKGFVYHEVDEDEIFGMLPTPHIVLDNVEVFDDISFLW
ncbi:DREBa [Artemisia annua]|uniref:DREBa n=1 Tax=Artemisia annua TaxID=35608 RepID=A0A2U1PKT1_ARTAN|nr:DREBa [Artemisia annua]